MAAAGMSPHFSDPDGTTVAIAGAGVPAFLAGALD